MHPSFRLIPALLISVGGQRNSP